MLYICMHAYACLLVVGCVVAELMTEAHAARRLADSPPSALCPRPSNEQQHSPKQTARQPDCLCSLTPTARISRALQRIETSSVAYVAMSASMDCQFCMVVVLHGDGGCAWRWWFAMRGGFHGVAF